MNNVGLQARVNSGGENRPKGSKEGAEHGHNRLIIIRAPNNLLA